MSERVCIACKVIKPFSEFHKNKRGLYGIHNKCKVCQNAFSKERYKKQGEKLRGQMAALRQSNYEYRLEIERASRARRKEAQRPLKNARQQVRNRLLGGSKFVLRSKEIQRLYELPCYNCGSKENLSIDHVLPLKRGGNHSIGNLMTLCRSCNASKGKKLLVEWKRDLMKVAGK
jgi:5-methylcytosine-specific restriction endonuclease McrA